ncbi:uncharacterized protein LOC107884559 [Acyrthosiphon pisum]|uniref:Probable transcriptional regulator ycf27 n=1 Tax=Acyrthosiphon pisum TaxID=7029 RepID=A0A8R2NL90_ACYPI|nr:uncharacterized protein LOC107884559 [Acyrthosiphon pisum]
MRILVVEDDIGTGDYLKKGLGEAGYSVDLARNGTDGLFRALEQDYDAIVLDVMLPGLDGWQIIEVLRKKSDVPILFLTARDGVQDRIHGLELGADDYLIKPFSFTELVLRLRTLLRRGPAREADHYAIADLQLDVLRRRAVRQDQNKNQNCLPECFNHFQNCRITLDCTEISCDIPKSLLDQKLTYSSYKNKNTLKGLIGVAPNGVITYASKLYPGSTSDKKIVGHCGVLNILEPGDLVLADKGFLISDLMPPETSLNIPPFLMSPQFTPSEVLKT